MSHTALVIGGFLTELFFKNILLVSFNFFRLHLWTLKQCMKQPHIAIYDQFVS